MIGIPLLGQKGHKNYFHYKPKIKFTWNKFKREKMNTPNYDNSYIVVIFSHAHNFVH
jgi:hypothetical protein